MRRPNLRSGKSRNTVSCAICKRKVDQLDGMIIGGIRGLRNDSDKSRRKRVVCLDCFYKRENSAYINRINKLDMASVLPKRGMYG